jgi:hydrogenase maturation factor
MNNFVLDNKKVFQIFIYYTQYVVYHVGFAFVVLEKQLTRQKKLVTTDFVELFPAHLSK